ncbi:hypothetical protein EON64_00790 [archaeon]|nr:MAG: hypothetical protein EON64_00790 [archaeon]
MEVNPHLLTSPLSPLSLAVQQMTPLPPWYRGAELVGLLLRRLADEGWERCDSRYASSSSAAPCPELEGVRREMRRGTEALRKAMLELIEREVMQTIRQQEEMHEKAKEEWREVLLSDERATSEGTSQQPFYP